MATGDWYYCLDHHVVEPYDGCRSASRLGPYPTRGDAENALTKVAERNDEWDNDPRFHELDENGKPKNPDDEDGFGPFHR